MRDYLDTNFCDEVIAADLPFKKISNVIRLSLIAKHGGVYADADCFCTRPLDTWIHEAAKSGFFAFRFIESDRWLNDRSVSGWRRLVTKTKDRALASWFMAGTPENEITGRILIPHFRLLACATKSKKWYGRSVSQRIYKMLRRNSYLASLTGNPTFIDRVGSYPFYIIHYHFAHLVMTDPVFGEVWAQVEKRSADDAITYSQTLGLPVDQGFKNDMRGGGSPVYKFHFKKTAPLQQETYTRYEWLQEQAAS